MSLSQRERNKIRYAFEDAGMPDVLAFMAGQVATSPLHALKITPDGRPDIWRLCAWSSTPQGHEFWRAVTADYEQGLDTGWV